MCQCHMLEDFQNLEYAVIDCVDVPVERHEHIRFRFKLVLGVTPLVSGMHIYC